jgi:hypothetical protein
MTTAIKYRLHPIHRDDDEKYVAVYGRGDVKVIDISDGSAATMDIDAAADLYLNFQNPTADQMRLVTIADTSIILNTKKTPAVEEAVTTFIITGTFDTYSEMISQRSPADGNYYRVLNDDSLNLAGFYRYVLSSLTVTGDPAKWVSQQMEGPLRKPGGKWMRASFNDVNKSRVGGGFRIRFQKRKFSPAGTDTYTHSTRTYTSTGLFAGYTFEAGDELHVSATPNGTLNLGWYPIASNTDNTVVFVDGGSGKVTYRDINDESADHTTGNDTSLSTDGITVSGGMVEDFRTNKPSDMDEVAQRIETKLQQETGLENALVGYDSTALQFTIHSPFQGTEATVVHITDPDTGVDWSDGNDDPFNFGKGAATTGTGVVAGETDVDERWDQVAAPGEGSSKIDAGTMPLKMERTSTSPLTFTVRLLEWADRLSGDADTNPAPSIFVDKDGDAAGLTLTDVSFWRNRLALSAGENVVLSQDGDFFNFFLTDHDNIVDSDPIDLTVGVSNQVTLVDYMVPYSNTMTVFSKSGNQFEITSDGPLKQDSASVVITTSHDSTPNVRPQVMDNSIFFTGPDGLRAQLWDSRFRDDVGRSVAENVSSHVPQLMDSDVKTVAVHANTGAAFILTNECNIVYTYRQFKDGPRREQAAWGKWEFHSQNQIDDIAVIEDELILLVFDTAEGTRTLEKIDISQSVVSIDTSGCQSLPTVTCD